MTIAVGSTNPVKIEAVRRAFLKLDPNVRVVGVEAQSGVSHQPRSDEETRKGSENRARSALRLTPKADIGFGLEGGVQETSEGLSNTVWVCLVDKDDHVFFANGERFILPRSIADAIQAGGEMGPVLDTMIKQENVKQKQGMIGIISKGYIDRTEIYSNLAKLVIGLWYGRDWEKEYV
ncbi:MAG: DUF84 family protein [Candidatus Pacebacteria bacterium]|nr:DUF84 family protein [Candidatus Paceibacterota bacterium]